MRSGYVFTNLKLPNAASLNGRNEAVKENRAGTGPDTGGVE